MENIELSDFKNKADVYYQQLTKASPIKGLGSHEHIYFTYGIEWAYNRMISQNNSLLEALKEIIELFPDKPKLPISFQVLDIAKAAIQKAEQ